MRIKNKWYKELWWAVRERLHRHSWYQERFEKEKFGYAYYLRCFKCGERKVIRPQLEPCTPEAKRHMKQVHKTKGRLKK